MSQIDPSDEEILAIARAGFLDEAREMLRQFEEALLALDEVPDDLETLNSAFRAAHTIKGTAGLFGCDRVVAFTHDVETLLEAVRSGQYQLNDEAMALLLSSRDQMEALLGDVESAKGDPDLNAMSKELSADLRALLGGAGEKAGAAEHASDVAPAEAVGTDCMWRVWVQFGGDALRNGLDPLSFLRYLSTQGTVHKVKVLSSQVPDLQALDAEECHMGFEVEFETSGDRDSIASVFEFAIDDCELHIDPLSPAKVEGPSDLAASLVDVVESVVKDEQVEDEQVVDAEPAERRTAQGDRRKASRDRRSDETRFVRVQADKLDRLIDLVGELVIASSGAQLVAQQEGSSTFAEAALRIRTLVESARDGALALRMVPIGETFARFHRVVRDVSKQLGKQVDLQITGADTELDKSMVEVIADPLMHLVRNSLDHGLETTEERVAAGKPERGVIALHAYHEGGQVMIEVTDDGRGLNRERILKKAIERGLVRSDQVLSDHEVDQLICAPGFSTADQVTDISGRGVGMDVVKRSIESLRGQMQLASEWGRGTTTQIRLPLTLAIIDGFLTSVGGTYYVMPMEIVSECIEVPPECSQTQDVGVGYFNLRGEVLPYFDIALLHKVKPASNGRRSLVVARDGNTQIGLIVDKLHGEYQTVIKPLSSLFRHLRAIAGSTILGSGDVALVLDVPALVSYAVEATRPGGAGRTPFSLHSNGTNEPTQRIS
ncbi:MAG TPA: chemotaxis protein CheA [Aquabacterium sp.]|uniref:chemotaxis protein CheA n=1 Tax=Aquabacterium sp. TaxID=1872578 RepID=UPI002E34D07C|nr:chemotaxis protein CheA [Aquabacterium sp.]HEX5354673.1 chemotaxis protein CheA [Aquabacterium sp.]